MDIVERLREWKNSPLFNWADLDPSDMEEAADEIERLREELKELSESIGLQRDDAFEHGFGRGEEEGLQIGYKKGYDAAMKEKE